MQTHSYVYKIFFQNGKKALKKEFGNGKVSFLRLDTTSSHRSDEYCLLKCVSTFLEDSTWLSITLKVKAEIDWNTRLQIRDQSVQRIGVSMQIFGQKWIHKYTQHRLLRIYQWWKCDSEHQQHSRLNDLACCAYIFCSKSWDDYLHQICRASIRISSVQIQIYLLMLESLLLLFW